LRLAMVHGWVVADKCGRGIRLSKFKGETTVVQETPFERTFLPQGLKWVGENSSFAPPGLIGFHFYPRLAPWAAFLRRFAAMEDLFSAGQ
jgi:hypothetical protein